MLALLHSADRVAHQDPKIIGMLEKDHNITPEKAENEIKRNRFNNVTTTYYLLLKRKERAGIFRM